MIDKILSDNWIDRCFPAIRQFIRSTIFPSLLFPKFVTGINPLYVYISRNIN
jgi:hypothetical protein